jgi:ADP-L-glycero-D-manno-heptose 6-epimerase
MKTRVVVTGGAGFIGCNLAAALNAGGCDNLLVVDRIDCPGKEKNLEALTYRDYLDKDDFRDRVRKNALRDVAAVFHLGACSSTTETDEAYMMDNNLAYTRELCEWCLGRDVRFVYASSAATYGDGSLGYSDRDEVTPRLQPLNLYGWSKQLFDRWALESGALRRIAGLKYFNVYGPHEDHKGDMRSVVNKAFHQIRETGEVRLFKSARPDFADGEQERDFVAVKDAVKVTLFFYDHPGVSGLFNCGTGRARTWLDLSRAVFAALEMSPRITFIAMPAAIRDRYQYHTEADITKLRQAGYADPMTSLENGVEEYVRGTLLKQSRT